MNSISGKTWIIIAVGTFLSILTMGVFCIGSGFLLFNTVKFEPSPPLVVSMPAEVPNVPYQIVATICDNSGEKASWLLSTSGVQKKHDKSSEEKCFQEELVLPAIGDETFTIFRCTGECNGWKPKYYENVGVLFADSHNVSLTVTYTKDAAGKESVAIDQTNGVFPQK